MNQNPAKKPAKQSVSTYCYQCVAGPDLLSVQVEDGVATEVIPNFKAAEVHPAGGKICLKAYGLIHKTYNPRRVKTPMKRTNPRKGRGEDPGGVRGHGAAHDRAVRVDQDHLTEPARDGDDRCRIMVLGFPGCRRLPPIGEESGLVGQGRQVADPDQVTG